MIEMGMCEHNRLHLKPSFDQLIVEPGPHIRRIKHDSFLTALSVKEVAIGLDHADHKTVYLHISMTVIHRT